ncbi:hypothetical protein MHBO_003055, partial [Bonamia ostreae]
NIDPASLANPGTLEPTPPEPTPPEPTPSIPDTGSSTKAGDVCHKWDEVNNGTTEENCNSCIAGKSSYNWPCNKRGLCDCGLESSISCHAFDPDHTDGVFDGDCKVCEFPNPKYAATWPCIDTVCACSKK